MVCGQCWQPPSPTSFNSVLWNSYVSYYIGLSEGFFPLIALLDPIDQHIIIQLIPLLMDIQVVLKVSLL